MLPAPGNGQPFVPFRGLGKALSPRPNSRVHILRPLAGQNLKDSSNSPAPRPLCCEKAIQLAQQSLKLSPDKLSTLDTLTEAYFQAGKREDAIKTAQQALELAPENPDIKNRLEQLQK